MGNQLKRRRFQFSLRSLLIAQAIVLGTLWLGGRVDYRGTAKSKRAYVFITPRLSRLHRLNSIAFAREPRVRFVCFYWRGGGAVPTAIVLHDDGTVEWQHCRTGDQFRIW